MSEQVPEKITLAKSRWGKLRNAIVDNEDIQEMWLYAKDDVLKPLLKLAFKASSTNFVNSVLNTNLSPNDIRKVVESVKKDDDGTPGEPRNYNKESTEKALAKSSVGHKVPINGYEDILLDSEEKAQKVLEFVNETVDKYGKISVSTFIEACGHECEYTGNRWGWTNVTGVHIVQRIRGNVSGWAVQMPSKAKEI